MSWPAIWAATQSTVSVPYSGCSKRRSRWAADRARYIATFMRRYGFWAIAVAAITPFPFSAATWASGAAGISPRIVLLGSLFRAPKVLFYFVLIVLSWDLGTGW